MNSDYIVPMTQITYKKVFLLLWKVEGIEGDCDDDDDYTPTWGKKLFGKWFLKVRPFPNHTFKRL